MNLVILFTHPVTPTAARCFMTLLTEEVGRWGGFRGKKIASLTQNPLDDGADRLHLNIDYAGPPEGDEEIIDALRELLSDPREPWGVGRARVRSVARP